METFLQSIQFKGNKREKKSIPKYVEYDFLVQIT